MALTQINSYPVSHNKGGSGGGNTYVFGGNNSTIYDTINVKNINATNGNIDYLKSKSISANDASFMFFQSSEGSIQTLMGNKLQYNTGLFGDVEADTINAKKIQTDDLESLHAYIKELQSKEITTEYLTVTKQAHFFELLIDKIRSVGGQLIITPASCIIDYVYAHTSNGYVVPTPENYESIDYFDVYWKATDSDERKISNDFLANDQVICQSFNNVSEGVNYNISNKYYWRLVNSLLPDKYINLTTGAQSNSQQNSSTNDFEVILYNTTLTDLNTEADVYNGISWEAAAQTIEGIETNVSWTYGTIGVGEAIHGTFSTNSQLYGMQITPDDSIEVMPLTNKVHLRIRQIVENSYIIPQKINIGFYFKDDTYIIYNNVVFDGEGNVTFEFPDINESIKGIIIVSTADVNWHWCHGMRISNTVCDNVLSGFSAIPGAGDNLVQLGYRGTDEENSQRQSAIIISSYNTIDQGGQLIDGTVLRPIKAPSYAQYIGIKTFDLYKYRQSFFDAKGAAFKGDISLCSVGEETLEEALENAGRTTYLHIAYANSADGQQDFTKIPVTGVEYQYLGFCTDYNEDDEDLVYSDYQWALVPGSNGDAGDHWEFAYCNTNNWQTPPNPPAAGTTINALPQGWYKEPQPLQSGYYTWMSQCRVSGATGIYGTWELPIRLTGDKGENGADGNEIEFIYTRNNGTASGQPDPPVAPVYDSNNRLVKEQDDWHGTDSNGVVWTDNPQGIEENLKYEYVCQRIRRLGVWGDYYPSNAAIWSSWGKKGQDGDGYEYIYMHYSQAQEFGQNNSNPAYWPAVQTDEYYGPSGYEWSDDPMGVDTDNRVEYVSVRKRIGGTWGKFSTPALWAQYTPRGADGGRYIFMYQQTIDAVNGPSVPVAASSTSTMESAGWSETMPAPEANKYIWMTQAFFASAQTTAVWSAAVRMTGADGKAGEDGTDIEFIYTTNNTGTAPAAPPSNTTYPDDWHGTDSNGVTWTDNPSGVSENNKWEYVCQRMKENGTWGAYKPNPAAVWSKWGEKGQDGDGYEYIYKHFTTEQTFSSDNNNPAYWSAVQTDEYYGPSDYEWSDDPVGVDSTDKFEYVSVRKKISGTWQQFSTPTLWSRYAAQGADGGRYINMYRQITSSTEAPDIPYVAASISTMESMGWLQSMPQQEANKFIWMTEAFFADGATTSMWSNPVRLTGDNGKPGEDGNTIEYIYKHFTNTVNWSSVSSNQNPANWSANQSPDYLGPSGYEWSDNPVGIDSTNKFEYVATREYKLWPGDTEKKWGPFTTPVLWSNWGEKGTDGDGYEYIFKAFGAAQTFGNNNYNPAYWAASSSDEYVGPTGYEWSDDPVALDDTNNKIEYVAVRKRINGTWGQFTTPQIWAMYGGTGPAGADGKPIEYMYKNATTTPTISNTMASETEMRTEGWTFTASTPENGKYMYMTWSYMNPSNLDAPLAPGWRTPVRISGPHGKNAVEYKLIDQGSAAYVNLKLDSNNKITQSMIFNLKFKVMRLEGSSMRFMQMGEMRDWPKVFSTNSNQNGFYAYALFTKGTTSNPTYYNYKMTLNTSDSDSDDALFTLEYTANVPAENTDSNYITVNNKEITVRLIEANVGSSFSNTNTTILSHTHDSFNVQVSLQSKATLNVLNDSIATLVAADTANATNISTVSQTASAIDARVQTIEGNYVTQTRFTQESNYFKWQVNQEMLDFTANNQMMVNLMGLDTTKFYPVSISLPHTQNYSRIRIQRNLSASEYGDGPSDYGTHANSNYGFVLDLDWSAISSGWGTNWQPDKYPNTDWTSAFIVGKPTIAENAFVARYIHKYYTAWTKDQTVGSDTIPYDYIAGNIEQNFMGSLCRKLSSNSNTNKCPVFYEHLYNLANERATADYNNDPDKSVSIASRRTTLLNQYITKYRNGGWNDEIVYLRGGSKYLVQTEYEYSVIEPCTSGYNWSDVSGGVTYTCSRPVKSYSNFAPNKVDAMSRSEIIQTADSIRLSVYDDLERTGIDIENGKITLDAANTLITGDNLVLEQTQGITIKDDDNFNNINISGKNIESNGFGANSVYFITQTGVKSNICVFPQGQSTTNTFTWDEELISQLFNIGQLNSGSKIELKIPNNGTWANPAWGIHSANKNSAIGPQIANDPLFTVKLWEDSTVKKTLTIGKTNINPTGSLDYNVTSNGHSYKVTFELQPVTVSYPNYLNTSIYASFQISFRITAANNNSVNIGTNGANFVARPYNMQINNENGIILENINSGKSGIKIDDTNAVPLQKASNGGWVTNGNILRVRNLNNSTGDVLSNDYDLYIYTMASVVGGEHKFNLPTSGVPIGRTVYFKSTNQNLKLINSQIILRDNTGIQTECSLGNHFAIAVFTGSYWLVHY